MNNLQKRALSGIVYVIIVLVCLLCSKIAFCLFFAIVTGWAIDEFNRMIEDSGAAQPNRMMTMLAGVYLFLVFFLIFTGSFNGNPLLLFLPYALTLLYLIASELFLHRPQPVANWVYALAGQVYIALPLALLNVLAFGLDGFSPWGNAALCLFIFLWLNDSGAYIFGSLLHKKIPYPLAPSVSPHKTWIGSIGGAVMVFAAATICHFISSQQTLLFWWGMGFTSILFGTLGDLVESQLKRQSNIKDSGRFLPGHGGVLDRFDSVLLSVPAFLIYIYCFSSLSA